MVASKLVTVEELDAMGQGAERRELIAGVMYDVPAAGGSHGSIGGRILGEVYAFALTSGLGEVFLSETGFVVAQDPDSVLMPDVSFINRERLPGDVIWQGFVPIAPDLAVEIESPSNSRAELRQKAALYIQGGSRLVWLVWPERRAVTVVRPGQPDVEITETGNLDGFDVLPGFQLLLSVIFRSIGSPT